MNTKTGVEAEIGLAAEVKAETESENESVNETESGNVSAKETESETGINSTGLVIDHMRGPVIDLVIELLEAGRQGLLIEHQIPRLTKVEDTCLNMLLKEGLLLKD